MEPSEDTSRTVSISVLPSSITPCGTVSVFGICGVGVRAAGVRPAGVFSTIAIGVAVCHVHVAVISIVMTASRHFPGVIAKWTVGVVVGGAVNDVAK